ncbi:MAG: hypothetical protein HYR85_18780 [Planctomycetes bacterium]|nr:hypothetical protein [Planctomycetota bacterium]MBI3847367.1 hypothetical protein [Planctomycetota bacterium]
MNRIGQFVVTWSNGTGLNVSVRAYGADGAPITGEHVANATTAGTQNEPTVAIDDSGDFVVAWTDYNGRDGDALGVIAQRYTSDGVRAGPEFVVPSIVAGSQFQPQAAMDSAGNFAIAWVDSTNGGTPDVWARFFLADGTPRGPQVLVNVRTQSNQVGPAIAMAADGRCVIAWMDRGAADGSGHGVFFRLFGAGGTPRTGDVAAPVVVAGDQKDPYVAMTRDGRFVVAWTDWSGLDGDGAGVYFRAFDRFGQPTTGQVRANDVVSGNQFPSPVGIDDEGRVTVAWIETSGRDGSGSGIFARCFAASGAAMGPAFRVNSTVNLDQAAPSVAVADSGEAVIAFEDRSGADGESDGIFAQRFAAPPPPPMEVSAIGPLGIAALAAMIALYTAFLFRRAS